MLTHEVCFPKEYKPRTFFTCSHCATIAIGGRIAGVTGWERQRMNQAYACDLRYEGCEQPDGVKRR